MNGAHSIYVNSRYPHILADIIDANISLFIKIELPIISGQNINRKNPLKVII